jgi:hypothetical protein
MQDIDAIKAHSCSFVDTLSIGSFKPSLNRQKEYVETAIRLWCAGFSAEPIISGKVNPFSIRAEQQLAKPNAAVQPAMKFLRLIVFIIVPLLIRSLYKPIVVTNN